jgi:hypothetical protein
MSEARIAKKFFARGKNFRENMLHNFSNFVQLPASDNGDSRISCTERISEEIDSLRELRCE